MNAKEQIVNQHSFGLFNSYLSEGIGVGFIWEQGKKVNPSMFNPTKPQAGIIYLPEWFGYKQNLMGQKEDTKPNYILRVRRINIRFDPIAEAPETTKTNTPIAPKSPMAPPKGYGTYAVDLYQQTTRSGMIDKSSILIFQAEVEGLEENGHLSGLRQYLMNKFHFNFGDVKPVSNLSWGIQRKASDMSNWYSGAIPDPKQLEQYIGTANVDASQISSAFNGVNKAVQMVNQFDGSLLRSIAFIFNTSGNAYGVYVPALDQAINNEKTKSHLRSKGCEVKDLPNGAFTASPQDPTKITPEQVQSEIHRLEGELKSQGGHAFGINMNKVLESAKADQANLRQKTSRDFEFMAVIHLGETMAHEATHAKGAQDEGAPTSVQQAFVNWALPKIDYERKQLWMSENQGATPDQYVPIQMTANMRTASWYRKAMEKFAFAGKRSPSGSMFQNRMNRRDNTRSQKPQPRDGTTPSWAGIFWKSPHTTLETMLQQPDSEYSNKDSIEKRMRIDRQKSSMEKLDPNALTSELLDEDRNPTSSYSSIEKLLEDQRPKPMILSSNKSLMKYAYTDGVDGCNSGFENFGWMNNLALTQRERMKTSVEVDDDLATNQDESIHGDREKSISQLSRYNPEYAEEGGCKGIFHSVWSEPRWEPELFDQMADERSRTSPGSHFASDNFQKYRELADFILQAMNLTKSEIENNRINGTRFIISPHLVTAVEDYFKNDHSLRVVPINVKPNMSAVWVVRNTIQDHEIALAEDFATGKDCGKEASFAMDNITCLSKIKKEIIDEILQASKEICEINGLHGIYIVGGFPRSLALSEPYAEVRDLDFASANPDEGLKLGGLLAEKLGIQPEFLHRTMTMTWIYKGIKCDFRGKEIALVDRQQFRNNNIPTIPLNLDIYSRDLTINMLIYKLSDGKIYDVSKISFKDLKSGILRTFFPAIEVVPGNPLIILRTLKYANRYPSFVIAPDLQTAMKSNIDKLDSLGTERISRGINDILKEGTIHGMELIKEYNLDKFLPKDEHATNSIKH